MRKLVFKSLLYIFYYNNPYKFKVIDSFMNKDKRMQEWGYWFKTANHASKGLFASSNFLENGVLINYDVKQSLKDFLKSCEAGRKLQSSLEKMLEKSDDPGEMERKFVKIKNYQDVFSKIIRYDVEVYTYLNAVDGLEKEDKGSAKILRDFYSKMLKYSSQKIYECSQNI